MNTKNILFICGGAFDGVEKIIEKRVNQKGIGFGAEILSKSEMEQRNVLSQIQPHDLLKFGIIPELVGRLPVITALEPLRREDLVRILTEPKNALVKQYQKLLEYDMVKLVFTPGSLEAVADKSMERGIGARGLRAVLEEIMSPIMYDIPSDSAIVEVDITPESVKDGAEPVLIRDPNRLPGPIWGRRPCGPRPAVWPGRTGLPNGAVPQTSEGNHRAEGETSPPFLPIPARAGVGLWKGSESVCLRKKRPNARNCIPCPPWPCGG